jgi:hypothetical protein
MNSAIEGVDGYRPDIRERSFVAARHVMVEKGARATTQVIKDVAKKFGISPGSVARAYNVIQYGGPELEKAVIRKELPMEAAASMVRPKIAASRATKKPRSDRQASAAQAAYQRALENRINLPKAKFRSPQEVDPDFRGTSTDFLTKHGHVNTRTAAQKEKEAAAKRADAFMVWMQRCMESAPAEIMDADILEWIRGSGADPSYRRDKLTRRWADFDNLHARLTTLMAQLESLQHCRPSH